MRALDPDVDLPRALARKVFGPSRPSRLGSSPARVTYRDTDRMANLDACWCGEPVRHDWPGKADGDPHPR